MASAKHTDVTLMISYINLWGKEPPQSTQIQQRRENNKLGLRDLLPAINTAILSQQSFIQIQGIFLVAQESPLQTVWGSKGLGTSIFSSPVHPLSLDSELLANRSCVVCICHMEHSARRRVSSASGGLALSLSIVSGRQVILTMGWYLRPCKHSFFCKHLSSPCLCQALCQTLDCHLL